MTPSATVNRWGIPISFVWWLSRAWLVVRCRVGQLPNQRGTQVVDSLVDQVGGMKFVAGVNVRCGIVDEVGVAASPSYLVAELISASQSVGRAGDVVARPHRHLDRVGPGVGACPENPDAQRQREQNGRCDHQ